MSQGEMSADAGKERGRSWAMGVVGVTSALVALVSYRYVWGIGPLPPLIAENSLRAPWLPLHAAFSATALLLVPLQLHGGLRRRAPRLHRWLGHVYVACAVVGAIAGLALAWGSAAGAIASLGFGLLAVAWLVTTLLGWQAGRRGQLSRHRDWMIRSCSLTLAAVTLRVYLALLPALPLSFLDGYRVIAFLCWIPNWLAAELLLSGLRSPRAFARARSAAQRE